MSYASHLADWCRLQWQLVRPYGRYLYYTLHSDRWPENFQKSWTYPSHRLEAAGHVVTQPEKFVCFFFPMTDWHSRKQRTQHLAESIVKEGCASVCMNPNLGLEYRWPYWFDPDSRVSTLGSGLAELHIHLPREHAFHERVLTAEESGYIAAEIVRLIRGCAINRAALIVSFPIWLEVAQQLRQRYGFPIIYDCHDWLPGFMRISPKVIAAEKDLLAAADAVVFSSQYLMDRVVGPPLARARAGIIRNAVDPSVYGGMSMRQEKRQPPTAGYMGALDYWFDIEAVLEAVRDHPEWSFEFVGRVEDATLLRLEEHHNVRFLGEVPHGSIAQYLCRWDVALLPFLRTELTLAANPIKLYEYFQAGVPVVSTRLPEVEIYKDLVYIADSSAEFSALLNKAVEEDSAALRQSRIVAMGKETWAARAQSLLEIIELLIPMPKKRS